VGLLFLIALVVAPVVASSRGRDRPGADRGRQPHGLTMADIRWSDPVLALPAFLTMITIPLTFSIATGVASA